MSIHAENSAYALLSDGATIEIRAARPDDFDAVRGSSQSCSSAMTWRSQDTCSRSSSRPWRSGSLEASATSPGSARPGHGGVVLTGPGRQTVAGSQICSCCSALANSRDAAPLPGTRSPGTVATARARHRASVRAGRFPRPCTGPATPAWPYCAAGSARRMRPGCAGACGACSLPPAWPPGGYPGTSARAGARPGRQARRDFRRRLLAVAAG